MDKTIKYPRNQLIRKSFQLIGRILIRLLTKTEINGFENYPKSGNLIVVGNHTGVMETVLMTSFAPRPIEYMGSVDIPHEPQMALFMNAYKFIPVFRGNVSPSSMKAGLAVLKQNGVIGIFPEGGIWEPAIRTAHSGAAWLSHHAGAPILPIGFSGTAGTLKEALSLKRPKLIMNIGKIIPPVKLSKNSSKKEQYQIASKQIMDSVWALIPEDDTSKTEQFEYEYFKFDVEIFNKAGEQIEIPERLYITAGSALSKILFRSTLINNFRDNLNLDIEPLKTLNKEPKANEIFDSTGQILSYLKTENPYYFTYRYGHKEGTDMQKGITQLHKLAQWASSNEFRIKATPTRIYQVQGSESEIVEVHPPDLKKW